MSFRVLSAELRTRAFLDWDLARRLISTFIEAPGGIFMPSHFGEEETGIPTFDPARIDQAIEIAQAGVLFLAGRRGSKWEAGLLFGSKEARAASKNKFAEINIAILEKHLSGKKMVRSFEALVERLFVESRADYARLRYYQADKPDPIELEKCLPEIYWKNFFGEVYLEFFGKDRLLSSPAWKTQEIPAGVMVQSAEKHEASGKDGFEPVKDGIKKHLGERAFRSGKKFFRGWRAPRFS